MQIIVPGDKSITHRALMLAALARGRSEIRSPLAAGDTRSTAGFLRRLGVPVSRLDPRSTVTVVGRPFRKPSTTLHCGNSGTTARLGLGLLASSRFASRLTGDASVRRRPMRRVIEPLMAMGARFDPPGAEHLPVVIRGGKLRAVRWALPVSSAQIKSAVLFAGLMGGVPVAVHEPNGRSRDHTERMLAALGCDITTVDDWIELAPAGPIPSFGLTVPGDASSAAFLVGAALLVGRAVTIAGVGLNPTRIGFIEVLRRMGASIDTAVEQEVLGEPIGTIDVRPSPSLRAVDVLPGEVPGLIDEIPILATVAARAEGTTRFAGVGELRVKESDRLALIAENLVTLGYQARGVDNTLVVTGSDHPPRGRVHTDFDHRLAMAFAALGRVRGASIRLDDRSSVGISFPGYFEALTAVTR